MKFNILNNEPLQFFNEAGDLIGTILISGSGDMIIRPESGSSKDIILGNQDTVGDVEIGLPSAEANLKLMGGGLISANGNTLTIGDSAAGDQLIFGAPITASLVQSASFAVTASHVIGGGGGSGTTVVANPGSSGGGALSTIGIAGTNFSIAGGSAASGTVSSSAQITSFGFVTSSATASFVTNSQTSSMTVFSSSFASTASLLLGTVVSASFAQTASFLLGGITTPTGTISGSAQITAFGFISSSATASLVTNSATASFVVNSQTSSFVANSQTGSFMTSSASGSFNNLTITHLSGSLIPGNGSTSSIAVTVADVNGANKYLLDGTITSSINLTAGNSYKFDQSDNSNNGHPFRFSTDTGGSSNYADGVTTDGTPGNAGAYTQISITNSTPTLYYYCTVHSNMGLGGVLSIITGSLIENGFLEVSGSTRLSGSLIAITSESIIRSQRPIVTVATNPFTASANNSGHYFRVGGNITCSIFVTASAHCPIGAEFDIFQTSSAGNMLFETGSGVTINSKNSNLNLAGQFSSATLKYIGLDEWDLMGDLT